MAEILVEPFGKTAEGIAVERYTLVNARGSRARLMTFGATWTEHWVPDRRGTLGDVLLGFDDLDGYEREGTWCGCIVGPVANRIAGARFELDGRAYRVEANDGANHLHGGRTGLSRKVWRAREVEREEGPAVRFETERPDGEGGFPGRLAVAVTYTLGDDDALAIEYRATTDAPTPVSLTNHAYFHLGAPERETAGSILGHELAIPAERVTEPGEGLIPTGRLVAVAGTGLDFRAGKPIGRDLARVPGGYDHNYVLKSARSDTLVRAAAVYEPTSGRRLVLETTEPGVQLYSGNFGDGWPGKRGARHPRHGGFCLETQGYPDAIHHPGFPSVVLRPGETYRQRTIHRFGVGDALEP